MKKYFGFGLFLLSAPAISITLTQFNSGEVISSSSMNGNFNTLKTALEAIPANYVAYPSGGNAGQYLVNNGMGAMQWQTPASPSVIPLAQDSGVTGGVISNTDYLNFLNKQDSISVLPPLQKAGNTLNITNASSYSSGSLTMTDWNMFNQKMDAPSGVPFGSIMIFNGTFWSPQSGQTEVGTQNSQHFSIVTQGLPRMKFDEIGSAVIGGTAPTGKLSIHHNGTSSPSGKMFDIKKDNVSIFTVDDNGHFSQDGFLGKINGGRTLNCINATPLLGDYQPAAPLEVEFGATNGSLIVPPTSGGIVYDIMIDIPYYAGSGTPYGIHVALIKDGSLIMKIPTGRSVKRLFQGTYEIKLACNGMTGDSVILISGESVVGLRKLQ